MPIYVIELNSLKDGEKLSTLPDIYRNNAPRFKDSYLELHGEPYAIPIAKYLPRPVGIFFKQAVTPKDLIGIFAKKLGGIHYDSNFSHEKSDLSKIHFLTKNRVFLNAEPIIFKLIDGVIFSLYHAALPLRETVVDHGIV